MVAAIFYTKTSARSREYFFKGDSPGILLAQFNNVQDLECMSRMGCCCGSKGDQSELEKLDAFLDKFRNDELTMEDLKDFSLKLSIGKIGVKAIAVNDEEIQKLEKSVR